MKVAMIVSRFLPARGGIINQVILLANELIKRGVEVEIHTGNVTFIGDKRVLLPLSRLNFDGLSIVIERDMLPVAPLHVRNLKISEDVDVINIRGHAELFTISALLRLYKTPKPIVVTTHGGLVASLLLPLIKHHISLDFRKYIIAKLKNLITRNVVVRLINKRVSMIIPYNEIEKKVLIIHGIDPARIHVISNYVPDEYFEFKPREEVLEEYGLRPYEYIITVSRIDYNKSLDQVIRAVADLRKQGIEVTYVMLGPDEGALNYYLELANKLDIMNYVKYLGVIKKERSKLLTLLHYSRAFVLPSRIEGQSNAVIEAMTQKTPVIISNTANFIGRLVRQSENGFVFRYGDISSLTNYLRKLFEDVGLRDKLGENAFKYAYEHHRLSKATDEYIKIFKMILSETR